MKRLRVVLHAHSTWSYDGHWELPRIARLFGRFGVDAVMMTEHDTGFPADRFDEYRAACDAASTSRCRLIPGIEYSDPGNDIHILTWGLDRFLGEGRAVEATLEDVRAAGGAAIFAHPARREAWRLFRGPWAALLDGIEIWNRKTDGVAPGAEALKLQAETGLAPTVGVDFHQARHLYPLDHLLEVPGGIGSQALEAALVRAIRAGDLSPCAWRRRLIGAGDSLPGSYPVHQSLEKTRQTLRALRPRRR